MRANEVWQVVLCQGVFSDLGELSRIALRLRRMSKRTHQRDFDPIAVTREPLKRGAAEHDLRPDSLMEGLSALHLGLGTSGPLFCDKVGGLFCRKRS